MYHTSLITSEPKSDFICDNIATKGQTKKFAHRLMHTCAHKVTWYGKSGDQLKENEVKWNKRLQKFEDFH